MSRDKRRDVPREIREFGEWEIVLNYLRTDEDVEGSVDAARRTQEALATCEWLQEIHGRVLAVRQVGR